MSFTVAIDARLAFGTYTGDSSYWTGLINALAEKDVDANFLFISNRPAPKVIPNTAPITWHVLPASSSRWWSYVSFPILARRMGATAIHTQYSLSPLVGKRGITTVHDVSFLLGPQWFKPKDRFLLQKLIPSACRRAAAVITVSETSRKEMTALIPNIAHKLHVTYNACPTTVQPINRSEAKAIVRRDYGIDCPYLLTVGTRWPRKNMKLALEASEKLSDAVPHRLLITGKAGWGEEQIGRRGVALGFVAQENLNALYSAADLYLAPSRHEGFGIPVLEAFRCGCPVMCSTGGALPEVAGNAAWVEPSWEASDWARAIEATLNDSSKIAEFIERGRAREQLFTWADTASKTLEIYRAVSA